MPAKTLPSAADAMRELADFNLKMLKGGELLTKVKAEDVQIATADRELVFSRDKVSLYRYAATADRRIDLPVLIAYGQVGRYTMTDLQEDRSMIRNLLAKGVDVYAIDWGSPSRADRWLTFEDYVQDYLKACVEHICTARKVRRVNLLGICEGGVFSLCFTALNPGLVENLILTITPVDFHTDQAAQGDGKGGARPGSAVGLMNQWARSLTPDDVDRLIEANGNLPGELIGYVFSMLTPTASLSKYNIGMLDVVDDEKKLLNFLRMEKWLADRPHHPGEAAKELLINLYQQNQLALGQFMLGGRRVDLTSITIPVLNVFAKEDHIIPPPCTQALRALVGTKDYTEIALEGGHIGVFVGGKSQGVVASGIFDWLHERARRTA
jgi:polyhydroxyalkanoate synthase subunit PhaC